MTNARLLAESIGADVEWVRQKAAEIYSANNFSVDGGIDDSVADVIKHAWREELHKASAKAPASDNMQPSPPSPPQERQAATGAGQKPDKNDNYSLSKTLKAGAQYLVDQKLVYSVVLGGQGCGKTAFYDISSRAVGNHSKFDLSSTKSGEVKIHKISPSIGDTHTCLVDIAGEDFRKYFLGNDDFNESAFDNVFSTKDVIGANDNENPNTPSSEFSQLEQQRLQALDSIFHGAHAIFVFVNLGHGSEYDDMHAKVRDAASMVFKRLGERLSTNIQVNFIINKADGCKLPDELPQPAMLYSFDGHDLRSEDAHTHFQNFDNAALSAMFNMFPQIIKPGSDSRKFFNCIYPITEIDGISDNIPEKWKYAVLLYPPHRYVARWASERVAALKTTNDNANATIWRRIYGRADAYRGNDEYKQADKHFVEFLKDDLLRFVKDNVVPKILRRFSKQVFLTIACICIFFAAGKYTYPNYEYDAASSHAKHYSTRAFRDIVNESGSAQVAAPTENLDDGEQIDFIKTLMFNYEKKTNRALWEVMLVEKDPQDPGKVARIEEANKKKTGCVNASLAASSVGDRKTSDLAFATRLLYEGSNSGFPSMVSRPRTQRAIQAKFEDDKYFEACYDAIAGLLKLRHEISIYDLSQPNATVKFRTKISELLQAYESINAMDGDLLGHYKFDDNYVREAPTLRAFAPKANETATSRFDLVDRRSKSGESYRNIDPCFELFTYGWVSRPLSHDGNTSNKCDSELQSLKWQNQKGEVLDPYRPSITFTRLSNDEQEAFCKKKGTPCKENGNLTLSILCFVLSLTLSGFLIWLIRERLVAIKRALKSLAWQAVTAIKDVFSGRSS